MLADVKCHTYSLEKRLSDDQCHMNPIVGSGKQLIEVTYFFKVSTDQLLVLIYRGLSSICLTCRNSVCSLLTAKVEFLRTTFLKRSLESFAFGPG